jgi:hypothetical protein
VQHLEEHVFTFGVKKKVVRWRFFTNMWSLSLSIGLLHPHSSCLCHLPRPKLTNITCKQKDSCN